MASDIAYFQVSTEEDWRIEIDFGGTFDLAGKTLRVEVRERVSAALKTTLTIGAGLTVTLPGKVVVYLAKASMAGWTRGEYTADLIDTSASMQRRIVPVRFLYDEPGKLPGGVKGNSAAVMVGNNQVVVTAVRGETGPIGATGPANTLTIGTVTTLPSTSLAEVTLSGTSPAQIVSFAIPKGADGIGGPADQGYQALLRQMELEVALARLATPVTDLPSLNLDFLSDTYFARKTAISASLPAFVSAMAGSFTRASAARHFDATGTLVQVASNTPRLDHDPVTLQRLGYLAEGARTNVVANPTAAGAVAGTPGTVPTGWLVSGSASGLTREIVGVGTSGGVPYLRVRWYGTASATTFLTIFPLGTTSAAASAGQTWAASQYMRLHAGSLPVVGAREFSLRWSDSGGGNLGGVTATSIAGLTTGALTSQRIVNIGTAVAGTAYVSSYAIIGVVSGTVVDFTIDVGWPQIELGAHATSPTEGARAADNLWIPSAPWLGAEMTILCWSAIARVNAGGSAIAWDLSNLAADSRLSEFIDSANTTQILAQIGGVSAGNVQALGSQSAGAVRRVATAASASGRRISGNGAAVVGNVNPVSPTFAQRIGIGASALGSTHYGGHIQRLICAPKHLTDAQLQALSGATL